MVNFLHHSDMIRIFPPIYSNAFLKLTACTASILHLTFFEKTMDKGDVILFSQKTPFHYLLFKNLSNFSHYNIIRNCLKAHLVNKGEMSCLEQKKLIFFFHCEILCTFSWLEHRKMIPQLFFKGIIIDTEMALNANRVLE